MDVRCIPRTANSPCTCARWRTPRPDVPLHRRPLRLLVPRPGFVPGLVPHVRRRGQAVGLRQAGGTRTAPTSRRIASPTLGRSPRHRVQCRLLTLFASRPPPHARLVLRLSLLHPLCLRIPMVFKLECPVAELQQAVTAPLHCPSSPLSSHTRPRLSPRRHTCWRLSPHQVMCLAGL